MMKSLILCALLSVALAGEIEFSDCDDGSNSPTTFSVSECDEAPCEVARGSSYDFAFDFASPIAADSLYVSIKAKVFGLWVPWPGAPAITCGQDIACPLVSGQGYTLKSTMTIPSLAPSISTTVQYSLLNSDTSEVVFCNRFPVRVA